MEDYSEMDWSFTKADSVAPPAATANATAPTLDLDVSDMSWSYTGTPVHVPLPKQTRITPKTFFRPRPVVKPLWYHPTPQLPPTQRSSPKRSFEEFSKDASHIPESGRYLMSGALPGSEQTQQKVPVQRLANVHVRTIDPSTYLLPRALSYIMTTVGTYFMYAASASGFTKLLPECLRDKTFQPIHIMASPTQGCKRRAVAMPGAWPSASPSVRRPHKPSHELNTPLKEILNHRSATSKLKSSVVASESPAQVSSIRRRFSRHIREKRHFPYKGLAKPISNKATMSAPLPTTKSKNADADALLQLTQPRLDDEVYVVQSAHVNVSGLANVSDGTARSVSGAGPTTTYEEDSPQSSSESEASSPESIDLVQGGDITVSNQSDKHVDTVGAGMEHMKIAPEELVKKPEDIALPPSPPATAELAPPLFGTRAYGGLPTTANLRGTQSKTLDEIFGDDEDDKLQLYCTEEELLEAQALREVSKARKAKQAAIKAEQDAEKARQREAERMAAQKAAEEAARKAAEEAAAIEAAKRATEAALKAERAARLIRSLNAAEVADVKKKLQERSSHQLRTNMTVQDLKTLVPNVQWLNDEIVNTYLGDLVKHAQQKLGYTAADKKAGKAPPFHNYQSFWFQTAKKGVKGVLSWDNRARLNNGRLLECEAVFIPVCEQYHWRLLIISGTRRKIEYFDSLHGNAGPFIKTAHEWVKANLGKLYKEEEWTIVRDHNSPRQQNGSDCGVFACMTALSTVQGLDIHRTLYDASERNMMVARYQIAATIIVNEDGGGFNNPALDWT